MVKLELNLPWKPVLAWPWGVTYVIDPETCLVTSHVESWDIAPLEVSINLFQLFSLCCRLEVLSETNQSTHDQTLVLTTFHSRGLNKSSVSLLSKLVRNK